MRNTYGASDFIQRNRPPKTTLKKYGSLQGGDNSFDQSSVNYRKISKFMISSTSGKQNMPYLQRSSQKNESMQVQKIGEMQKNCRVSIIQNQYMNDVLLNSCYTPTNKEKSISRWQTKDYQFSNNKYTTINIGSPKTKNTPSKFSSNFYQFSSVFNADNTQNYEHHHIPNKEKPSQTQNFTHQANRSISPIHPIQHHLQKSKQRFSNRSPSKISPKPRLSITNHSPTFKNSQVSPKYSFTSTFPSTPKKINDGTSQFYKITSTKQYQNQINFINEAKERFSLTVPTFGRNSIGDIGQNLQPKLNDFIIGQCKGQGRFGKVYMVMHRKTGFVCAMKKIKKESVKFILEQFIQEVKIQLYLNHPKLVKIYGYFSDFEYFYMLLEYMEQGSLYSLMKKHKKLDESQASQKLQQICSGIQQMHRQNIVHRDLKPENIVMSHVFYHFMQGVCKICDFGWAALCQGRRQTYCGTLDYVCPEIIQGQAYDSSVDVWCIGVMAYQMMCGKAPFFDISRKKTMQKIKQCKIQNYPSHLSKSAIAFIQMILQRNPDERVGIEQLLNSQFLKDKK